MGLQENESISPLGPKAKPRRWQDELKRLYRERHLTGLTWSGHPLAALRPWLGERGFVSAAQARDLDTGARVKLAGEVVIAHTPPQRDTTRVIFVTVEDETGLMDLAISIPDQAINAWVVRAYSLVLVWGRLARQGEKDVLVCVHKVSPPSLWLGGKRRAAPRGE
jgi:DNA polymerase III alpha subunit